jgi:hypothetical protein
VEVSCSVDDELLLCLLMLLVFLSLPCPCPFPWPVYIMVGGASPLNLRFFNICKYNGVLKENKIIKMRRKEREGKKRVVYSFDIDESIH